MRLRARVRAFVRSKHEIALMQEHCVQYVAGTFRSILPSTCYAACRRMTHDISNNDLFFFYKKYIALISQTVLNSGVEEILAHWKEMSSSRRLAPTLPLFVKERCVTINERMCRTSGFIQMYWFAKDWKLSHTITQIVIDVGHKVEFISCTSCNLKQHNAKHYQQWTHDAI